jgi:G3E family GTPase
VRGDLIRILSKLFRMKAKLDGIVIETTGLADPGPVAQTFFMDESMKEFARLDGIVTLVDAKHIEQHLDEEKPEGVENESVQQVAFADRLLLNKLDLVEEADLARVEERLREVNRYAPIVRCQNSEVAMDKVLGLRAFDLGRVLEMDPAFFQQKGTLFSVSREQRRHDTTVVSVGFERAGELHMERTNAWIGKLLQVTGCRCGTVTTTVISTSSTSSTTSTSSTISTSTSPSASLPVQEKGTDIFRMKGVLAMKGCDDKYVYQGVHMLFTGEALEPWGDAPRVNRLVFIGRNLDRDALLASFESCLDETQA